LKPNAPKKKNKKRKWIEATIEKYQASTTFHSLKYNWQIYF